uniref:Uncharacterized protein n=1 Tax=Otolemur garnettii TaxID=30611 RepID=H0XXT6_OTOGA
VKTSSSSHSAADRSSVGVPENKMAEKKATEDPKFASFPTGMYSESLRHFQGSSIGGQDVQVSQTKADPPATIQEPHILNLSERPTKSELTVESQLGFFKNTIRCLSENTQFSTKSKSIACLKHVSSPPDDNLWEEEEQQRDQAADAQGKNTPPSSEGGLDGCEITEAGKEVAVAKLFSLSFEDSAAVPLEQREIAQSVTQRPDQPHHRYSLPMIAIFSGPQHSESSPRPQLPVFSASPSLRELNLNVKPPSSIDQDIPGPERQWYPPLKGFPSGKSVIRVSMKATDSDEKASSTVGDGTADDRPVKPTTPPYPTSSTASCMPTPAFVTSWMSGALDQVQQGQPERLGVQVRPDNWDSQLGKGILHFGSNNINPYIPPWYPEGPAYIGWKQYVFGSAVDISSSQKPWDLTPSNMAQCSNMDNGLEDQNSPFLSPLSTHVNSQDLASTYSSIENSQASNEAQVLIGPSSRAPLLRQA